MAKNQTVQEQELKAERVQEEIALVAGEPFRISLKAERVQTPSASAEGPAAQGAAALALNLKLSEMQPVTITLTGQGTFISI
jgi:hypothetical protein